MLQKDKDPRIKCAIDYIQVNGQRFNYANQMMRRNYLCLVSKDRADEPSCPLFVKRIAEVNQLDRRYFFQTFVKEIAKSLQKMDPQNCVTIIKKVPKNIKYMSAILKIISLQKLSKLLQNDQFFLQLYVLLQETISKKARKDVNVQFIEDSIKQMAISYQRLFFLLDHLVLQNQILRNVLINCTKQIVLQEMSKEDFHQSKIFIKKIKRQDSESQIIQQNDQNDSKDLNSSTDTQSELSKNPKSQMCFVTFVSNSLGILKSMQKLKFNAQQINQFLLDDKLSHKIKQHFDQLYLVQHFSELLQHFSFYNCHNLWHKIFSRSHNLRYFQRMIYKSLIAYTDSLKRLQSGETKSIKSDQQGFRKQWMRCIHITQQLLKLFSKEANKFVERIILSMVESQIFLQNLPFISDFLQIKFKDSQSYRNLGSTDIIFLNELQKRLSKTLLQFKEKNKLTLADRRSKPILGKIRLSKKTTIVILKVYRILIQNQDKFDLQVSPEPIQYLLQISRKDKGALFGCRYQFIKFIKKSIHNERNIEEAEDDQGIQTDLNNIQNISQLERRNVSSMQKYTKIIAFD